MILYEIEAPLTFHREVAVGPRLVASLGQIGILKGKERCTACLFFCA